jgi:hypothetical protein
VPLDFIVRVELFEIQIWFEFKTIFNLEKRFAIRKGFLNPETGPGPFYFCLAFFHNDLAQHDSAHLPFSQLA